MKRLLLLPLLLNLAAKAMDTPKSPDNYLAKVRVQHAAIIQRRQALQKRQLDNSHKQAEYKESLTQALEESYDQLQEARGLYFGGIRYAKLIKSYLERNLAECKKLNVHFFNVEEKIKEDYKQKKQKSLKEIFNVERANRHMISIPPRNGGVQYI